MTLMKIILTKRTHLKVWLNAIGDRKWGGCEKGFTHQWTERHSTGGQAASGTYPHPALSLTGRGGIRRV